MLRSPSRVAPTSRNEGDANTDNVYEVTIVVSDGTLMDKLPVTVKVLNSTDDNDARDRWIVLEPAAGGCHRVDG